MTFELKMIRQEGNVSAYIASTPETRAICNDPMVAGMQYTRYLTSASRQVLSELKARSIFSPAEHETTVLNVLRGGLNFGLREALADAYGWNNHSSAFISAQRARREPKSEEWIITESSYKKIYLKPVSSIIFGDVVATGTSLRYALDRVVSSAKEMGSEIKHLLFFTIGGPNSYTIIKQVAASCREIFPSFLSAKVIYFEGEFAMATNESPLTIKLDGTDLLRRDCVMADAFTASQYEKATYPLERCTIYDAGSRSFDIAEYWHDVKGYWEQTMNLAERGMSFRQLLAERAPHLDAARFGDVDLRELIRDHLQSFPVAPRSHGHCEE